MAYSSDKSKAIRQPKIDAYNHPAVRALIAQIKKDDEHRDYHDQSRRIIEQWYQDGEIDFASMEQKLADWGHK